MAMSFNERWIREFYQSHPMPWSYDVDVHGMAKLPILDSNNGVVMLKDLVSFVASIRMELAYRNWVEIFEKEEIF